MRTDKYFAGSSCTHYWSNPWHYCYYCGRCHDEDKRHCEHYSKEENEDYQKKPIWEEEKDKYPRKDREMPKKKEGKPEWVHREEPDWDEEVERDDHKPKHRPDCGHRPEKQTHVHEFEGSVKLAEFDEDVHNHRIAGITGEAVKISGGHVHKIWTRTDFFDHFHYIEQYTGPAIYLYKDEGMDDADGEKISEAPHVHFIEGMTSENDGHRHEFQLATLIDSPLLPEAEAEYAKE